MQQNFVEETAAFTFFRAVGGSRFVPNVALSMPFGFILQRHMINRLKPQVNRIATVNSANDSCVGTYTDSPVETLQTQ
jgi:hypothetical protein